MIKATKIEERKKKLINTSIRLSTNKKKYQNNYELKREQLDFKNIFNNKESINSEKTYKSHKIKKSLPIIKRIKIDYLKLILFVSILAIESGNSFNNYFSYITLKVNTTGEVTIFNGDNRLIPPNEVYINGINMTKFKKTYNITQLETEIKLVWKRNINSTVYMFCLCQKIIEIDLSNFDASLVTSMNHMFDGCYNLISLNLSNLNTSGVIKMGFMFYHCSSLKELDLSNLDTSNVNYMAEMFYGCSSLISLNLSNFNTSKVYDMHWMFGYCSQLKDLNLSNFETHLVLDMEGMFFGCTNLESLDLSNFDGSKVQNMIIMFKGCSKLREVNLSNFYTPNLNLSRKVFEGCEQLRILDISNLDTSKVYSMEKMFYNCSSLKYLNLSNFNTSQVTDMSEMFYGCSSLNYLDLSNFDTSKVTNMSEMFYDCSSLYNLNLSNFNTSKVTNMSEMFYDCSSLYNLNLSNFNTSKVTNMEYMFYNCSSLNYLNLSNFNTSKVTNMRRIFYKCSSLNYLDLSNFDTSQLTNMGYMFYDCSSLNYLDLSNFNTSKVTIVSDMFYGCSSLNYIDLSNFNTSQVTSMIRMFYGCSSLNYLDLSNFNTSLIKSMDNMFRNCSSLIYLNLSNFITSQVTSMTRMFYGCTSLKYLDLSNFNTPKLTSLEYMFYGCSSLKYLDLSNFNTSKSSQMRSAFENCIKLEYINLKIGIKKTGATTNNILAYTPKNLLLCSYDKSWENLFSNYININCLDNDYNNISQFFCFMKNVNIDNNYICKICGENYNSTYNGSLIHKSTVNCISSIEKEVTTTNINYLLNQACYLSCKTCDLNGNDSVHNCIECGDDFIFEKNLNNSIYKNCYKNCSHYHYYDIILNKTYCTEYDHCPEIYKKLILDKSECIDNCSRDSTHIYEHENICYNESFSEKINNSYYIPYDNPLTYESTNNFQSNSINANTAQIPNKPDFINYSERSTNFQYNTIKNTDIITYNSNNTNEIGLDSNFIEKFIKGIDIEEIDQGNIKTLEKGDLSIILTSTKIQKLEENTNNITIDLKECEYILKDFYNISYNSPLYILKYIFEEKGMKIPKVEYEIYYPLHSNNLMRLNLSSCGRTKIDISIPVKINDSIEKYNSNSDYYNNICSKTTSKSGTDITLKDRRKEFIEQNMTLCDANCKLAEYDYNTEKVKCSCDIKLTLPLINEIKFNKEELIKGFTDIKNVANLNILKCYKYVLNKSLLKNYGNFIMLFIFLLYLICINIFRFRSYAKLKKEIYVIYKALKNLKQDKKIIKKKKGFKRKKRNLKKNPKKEEINNINNNNQLIQFQNFFNDNNNNNNNFRQITSNNEDISKNVILGINNDNNQNPETILEFKDFELNSMEYIEAIKSDKRSYIQYYISLLKNNHLFIFSFFPFNDFNSRIIKMFLFFFFYGLNLVVNALFFTEGTLHKIYQDEGHFNFLYQIPQIIHSSLISGIINILIKYLALSQDSIVKLKQEKNKEKLDEKYKEFMRDLIIKFIAFFVVTFLLLSFFWYYITCFCGIYINTQSHLIKDTTFSFIVSFIYPFGFCLIPGIFRIYALKDENKHRNLLYKFSLILNTILN